MLNEQATRTLFPLSGCCFNLIQVIPICAEGRKPAGKRIANHLITGYSRNQVGAVTGEQVAQMSICNFFSSGVEQVINNVTDHLRSGFAPPKD
jgi:hypothetical protein